LPHHLVRKVELRERFDARRQVERVVEGRLSLDGGQVGPDLI
jgi:hypothetical protein